MPMTYAAVPDPETAWAAIQYGIRGANPKTADPIANRSHQNVTLYTPQAATVKPRMVATTRTLVMLQAVPAGGFGVPANAAVSQRNVVP
jgi:hypothetical protein